MTTSTELVPIEPSVPAVLPQHPLRFAPGEVPPNRNPYLVLLATYASENTYRTIRGDLDRIAEIVAQTRDKTAPPKGSGETLAWWRLGYDDTAMVLAELLRRGRAIPTVNRHLSALRQVLKTAWRLGLMSAEDRATASSVENVKGERLLAGRNLSEAEVAAMVAACQRDERPHGLRDAAIIMLLCFTGLRRDEAAGALIENLDTAERSLKITGKGRKERLVPVHVIALEYVERWLAFSGASAGPIFPPLGRWGKIQPGRMHANEIGRIVNRRRQKAGQRPMTVHDFRRTFAGDMLDTPGVDIVTVQEILGHASVATTGRYDRRPARGRRTAVDKLHPGWAKGLPGTATGNEVTP